jgi:hypothetical protein
LNSPFLRNISRAWSFNVDCRAGTPGIGHDCRLTGAGCDMFLRSLRFALFHGWRQILRLHTTKTVGLPHARGHGELYDGVA